MPSPQNAPSILVVDDNPTNIRVLFEYLERHGFRVLAARDGESAIDQVQYAKPDLVLLDVMMPGMDGFETCRRLKQLPAGRDLPVLFMTALTDTVDKVRGFEAGAVDYLTKPLQHEEVLARVKAHLTIRELQQHLEQKNLRLREEIAVRQQAETLARQNEERLSRVLESAMDAIIVTDEAQRIRLFNVAAEKIFGMAAGQAVHQPFEQLLSEQSRRLYREAVQSLENLRGAKKFVWLPEGLRGTRSDGEHFPMEATISRGEHGPQTFLTIILRDVCERAKVEAELTRLRSANTYLQDELAASEESVGASESWQRILREVEKVAATESTVLITGETGTGKEVIARAVHDLSSRAKCVLVKVNCAALPSNLIESELFGHEKGAFTGATGRKLGRFELADGGTIFLDEVGELPLETQAKLLRVLQEQELERVGGTQTLKVNVRVVAATNRDLSQAMQQGRFRVDLFYRLNIFPIRIPPLRERRDDIPLLGHYFLNKFSRQMGKPVAEFSSNALAALSQYDWPGNVRELANVIERAIILCDSRSLELTHLAIATSPQTATGEDFSLDEAERRHILAILERANGVVGGPNGAATMLGLNRTTLIAKMKKLGIK